MTTKDESDAILASRALRAEPTHPKRPGTVESAFAVSTTSVALPTVALGERRSPVICKPTNLPLQTERLTSLVPGGQSVVPLYQQHTEPLACLSVKHARSAWERRSLCAIFRRVLYVLDAPVTSDALCTRTKRDGHRLERFLWNEPPRTASVSQRRNRRE